jgi:hypothetical protein
MLFTIFKKIYTFSFIKWLFRPSSTEIRLYKTYARLNYRNTIFRQYLLNSPKYLQTILTNKRLKSGLLNSTSIKDKKNDRPHNFTIRKQKY